MTGYTVRVRLRQVFWGLVILTVYLGVGLAWKMLLMTRYPPDDSTIMDELRREMRPYSSLPVGYLLGPRFGRMTVGLHRAGDVKAGSPAAARAFEQVRSVADTPGSWAELASFIAASLEQKPGWLPSARPLPTQTLVVMLDGQRWGRTTVDLSTSLADTRRRLRRIAEQRPDSALAGDALLRLADLDDNGWEFADAAVCRLAAQLLPAGRGSTAAPGELQDANAPAGRLAVAYVLFLRASPGRRETLRPSLIVDAHLAGDASLAEALGGPGTTSSTEAAVTPAVHVEVRGRAAAGVQVALLDVGRLRAALAGGGLLSNLAPGGVEAQSIMQAAQDMNPARTDDPMRAGALSLISPTLAAQVVRRLPVAPVDRDSMAHFSGNPFPAGVALLLTTPPGAPDICLAPDSEPSLPGRIRFVRRVRVLPTTVSGAGPPEIHWTAYPGAASYRVALALETPSETGWPSTALSPDWDRRVVWWRDRLRATHARVKAAGFVGPSQSLAGNGLWVGNIYRVMVVAEDDAGRPIASSIGLQDHPEEFFRPVTNWLALRGPGAQVPARPEAVRLQPRRRFERRGRPGAAANPGATTRSDPLEEVLAMARALSPPTLTGAANREADLTPVPLSSPAGVPLAAWSSESGTGQGLPPLRSGFLQNLLSQPQAMEMLAPAQTAGTAAGRAPGR